MIIKSILKECTHSSRVFTSREALILQTFCSIFNFITSIGSEAEIR